jgi:capsular polysaccharide biosynthesis protein
MGFDLGALFRMARRWWWLLLLAPLVGGGGMYLFAKSQQPMYRATAVLWIQMTPGLGSPDPSLIQGSIDLAEMYRYLVTVAPVLTPVIDDLDLPYGVDALRDRLSVSVVRSTPLLEISASDPQPERAAAIANAVSRHFGDSINHLGVNSVGLPATNPGTAAVQNLVVRTVLAELPEEPYAPRTTLFALLGAALGLLVAVGFAGFAEYRGINVRMSANPTTSPQESPRTGIHQVPTLQSGRD